MWQPAPGRATPSTSSEPPAGSTVTGLSTLSEDRERHAAQTGDRFQLAAQITLAESATLRANVPSRFISLPRSHWKNNISTGH